MGAVGRGSAPGHMALAGISAVSSKFRGSVGASRGNVAGDRDRRGDVGRRYSELAKSLRAGYEFAGIFADVGIQVHQWPVGHSAVVRRDRDGRVDAGIARKIGAATNGSLAIE